MKCLAMLKNVKKYDELGANWKQYEQQGFEGFGGGGRRYSSQGSQADFGGEFFGGGQGGFSDFFEAFFGGSGFSGGGFGSNVRGAEHVHDPKARI